jgi:D-3-phosphoglycerate dehydrogenase
MSTGNQQVVIVNGERKKGWGDDFAIERERWEPLGAKIISTEFTTDAALIAAAHQADVIAVIGSVAPVTAQVIQSLERCQLIIRYGLGVDTVDMEAATQHGVLVCNAGDYCVTEVSDHTVALILSLARRIVPLDRFVRAGNWRDSIPFSTPRRRLSTQTLGLVGLGQIGRQVARKIAPFIGKIVAYDPYVVQETADEYNVQLVELDHLLAQADFVSVHTPILPSTHHLINADRLAMMKPTAFIVNTSRGAVIDEAALIEILQTEQIAGAGLDVFESEPLAVDSPLRTLDTVIVTPHSAADSVESLQNNRTNVTRAVADVLGSYWPPYVMNPKVQPRFSLNRR